MKTRNTACSAVIAATFTALACASNTEQRRHLDLGDVSAKGGTYALGSAGTTGLPTLSSAGGRGGIPSSPTASDGFGSSQAVGGGLSRELGGARATGGSEASGGAEASGGSALPMAGAASGGAQGELLVVGAHYRLEIPCTSRDDDIQHCFEDPRASKLLSVNGDPQSIYKVTLHVRGLTEPYTFSDLNGQPLSTPTPGPYFLDSTQAKPDDTFYGLFWLDVQKPVRSYYANVFYTTEGDFHIRLFALDYMAEVAIQGSHTMSLNYRDANDHQVANLDDVVVPGVPPAPGAFDGQFLDLEVVSITPQ